MQVSVSRRQFLKISAGTVAAVAVADKVLALTALQPVIEVGNPLGEYPDRSWERVYHDQYRYDSSFTWCCSPNDTHGCRIRAFVRNGVVMRVEQNYDHQTYEDLYGNRGTFAHNPRMCLKGFTFHRRVYGPYRLKGPLMRKGWKQWMDDGSPELTPDVKRKYKFDSRFLDDLNRVSWDTAFTYVAKGAIEVGDRSFREGQMIVLDPTAEPTIKALMPSTVMVLGGEPVGPRVIWWNFVSSSQAKIDAAKEDWKAGRMALPADDDDEFIPLPDVPSTPEPAPKAEQA